MSGTELTISVNQIAPTSVSSVNTSAGGSWAAKTISLRVVAWYKSTETDVDFAGIRRAATATWNNIPVTAGQKVTVDFTALEGIDHYAFYYQVAASWNSANPAKKCTAVFSVPSAGLGSCVVADDDDTATVTFGATASTVIITPVLDLIPTPKELVVRGYNGSTVKKAWANDTLWDTLEIVLAMATSITPTYNLLMLKWLKYSIPIKVTESLTSTDVFITEYTGRLISTDYAHSKNKNSRDSFSYVFAVDTET